MNPGDRTEELRAAHVRGSRVPCVLGLLAAAALAACSPPAVEDAARWQSTLERVSRAVVTLRVNAPRAFDDRLPGFSTATGFIVDKQRGLILTNRHVVLAGPAVADAVLLNNEEITVRPIYRDPVHDFGFFRFDPADVRFMQVEELALRPDLAKVGTDIRVVGNDAGEQLSILAGTLARLDRAAPFYGRGTYGDYNTFYFQSASSISGGSSGSPMVNRDGHVIALTAGANRDSASSFFLPLDRVVVALQQLRAGQPVARAGLRAILLHRSYDELRRLGLSSETEAQVRKELPDAEGLLAVDQVLPGGPASGRLEPGDIVLRVGEQPVQGFAPFEAALDDALGRGVPLAVARGSERLGMELAPEDLHALAPAEYIEFGGGVVHGLSLTMARHYTLPLRGAYVALRGYLLGRAGVPHRAVVTALAGRDTPDLAAFSAALAELPDGVRVPVRYFELDSATTSATAVLQVDRRWYPMRRCRLDEASGRWPCTELPPPAPPEPAPVRETRFEKQANPVADALAASLVQVEFNIPFPLDGVHDVRFTGSGLVVDADRGLVVVDRETVPIALGDVDLTFAGSVRVPGELVYLHPEHDLAVVRYDPQRIGKTPVRSALLDPAPLAAGSDIWLIGLTGRSQLVSRRTSVSRIDSLELPLPSSPRFREMNLDAISLADAAPSIGGVISDDRGRVRALWASVSRGSGDSLQSFMTGIPIARVSEIAEPLRSGQPVLWRSLGIEWSEISLAQARDRGLPEPIARALEEATSGRRRVLAIARRRAGSPAAEQLRDGDLLASIEGQPIADFAGAERAVQKPQVRMQVVRDGQVLDLSVATEAMSGAGTERALIWAGALLQAPHPEVALQRGLSPSGVYVSYYFFGSPANRDNLGATRRIESVNGVATADLDAFLRAVSEIPDRGAVRLRTRTLDGKAEVITLRLDLEYWPTVELVRGPRGWERRLPALKREGALKPHGAAESGGAGGRAGAAPVGSGS